AGLPTHRGEGSPAGEVGVLNHDQGTAAKPSYIMALSPPLANSLTIAVTVPVPPSTTTEYCLSAASCEKDHGSMRTPPPAMRFTVCVKASAPPRKLYQLTVTVVAVT